MKTSQIKYCIGCKDDFYNGKNPYGIKQCFNLPSAKLTMRKRVHINEYPPWKNKPEKLPSCYTQKGYVFVEPHINQ